MTPEERAALEAQLKSLYSMKASGVLSVRHGDTSTYFRSLSEIDAAINSILGLLNAADGKKRRKVFYITQLTKAY